MTGMDITITALPVTDRNDVAFVKVRLSEGYQQKYIVRAGQFMTLTLTDKNGDVTEIEIEPGQSKVAASTGYSLKTRAIVKRAKGCAWWILVFLALIIYATVKGLFGH